MAPTIGRIVIVKNITHAIAPNNGATEAPAIITRVWSESDPGLFTVNLKVLLDGDENLWLTSMYLGTDDASIAEIHRRSVVENPCHAIWPPRV